MLGHEEPEDLLMLCDDCHRAIEGLPPSPWRRVLEVARFLVWVVFVWVVVFFIIEWAQTV